MIHLDSCLLMDLARENQREKPGPAWDVLESFDADETIGTSVFVVAELRAGAELARRPLQEHEAVDQLLAGLLIVYPDDRFAAIYGRLYAATLQGGRPMPALDLLIATAALTDDASLVTKNVRHFARVPGLRVIGY